MYIWTTYVCMQHLSFLFTISNQVERRRFHYLYSCCCMGELNNFRANYKKKIILFVKFYILSGAAAMWKIAQYKITMRREERTALATSAHQSAKTTKNFSSDNYNINLLCSKDFVFIYINIIIIIITIYFYVVVQFFGITSLVFHSFLIFNSYVHVCMPCMSHISLN